jgi:hypothetical protein
MYIFTYLNWLLWILNDRLQLYQRCGENSFSYKIKPSHRFIKKHIKSVFPLTDDKLGDSLVLLTVYRQHKQHKQSKQNTFPCESVQVSRVRSLTTRTPNKPDRGHSTVVCKFLLWTILKAWNNKKFVCFERKRTFRNETLVIFNYIEWIFTQYYVNLMVARDLWEKSHKRNETESNFQKYLNRNKNMRPNLRPLIGF